MGVANIIAWEKYDVSTLFLHDVIFEVIQWYRARQLKSTIQWRNRKKETHKSWLMYIFYEERQGWFLVEICKSETDIRNGDFIRLQCRVSQGKIADVFNEGGWEVL